jgi:5-deoxy-glucuronate isomerase
MTLSSQTLIHRSRSLPAGAAGTLLDVTPRLVGWKRIGFGVHRLAPGEVWQARNDDEERCVVLLNGTCSVRWDDAAWTTLGPRVSVFDSYPSAMYVPAGHTLEVRAEELTEFANCRAPSARRLEPRIVSPEDCGFEIRGGGNATRQIVDILPPSFPADRLLICEVFTPGGNWSSYPPHKHDVDNPPVEVALEETYYFRMRDPRGYGFQRIYTADRRIDETVMVQDGDLVVVRHGYHPFVTAFGFDAYYLNVLAGEHRSMAASDDPQYAEFRKSWPAPDPRMPLLPRPEALRESGRVFPETTP